MPYLRVVGRLLDDLRCHPERRTNEGVAFDLSVGELSCHTEICQLHLSLLGQQHVGSCRGGGNDGKLICLHLLRSCIASSDISVNAIYLYHQFIS